METFGKHTSEMKTRNLKMQSPGFRVGLRLVCEFTFLVGAFFLAIFDRTSSTMSFTISLVMVQTGTNSFEAMYSVLYLLDSISSNEHRSNIADAQKSKNLKRVHIRIAREGREG